MTLKIRTAAEYASATAETFKAQSEDYRATVVAFINHEITPKIEDMTANPGRYTTTGHASFKVPSYPTEKFVAEVRSLLAPLGFRVEQSHDGGGVYATVEVYWRKK
jgi:hypothetical protein